MEITTRDDFGKLVQQFYKTGNGAEIGVEYGVFSNQILKDWKGTLMSVDMWGSADIETHARKVLTKSCSILVKDT